MAKQQKGHSSPKLGRSTRPGQKAKRSRAVTRREKRKGRHVLNSNGKAFYNAWIDSRPGDLKFLHRPVNA